MHESAQNMYNNSDVPRHLSVTYARLMYNI